MIERRAPRAVDLPAQETAPQPGPVRSAEPRTPRALALDDIRLEEDAFEAPVAVPVDAPPVRGKGIGWGAIAVSAFLGLFGLAIAVWVEGLVSDLFALTPFAGAFALALVALLAIALVALAVRELRALRSLGTRYELHERAELAIAANDDRAADKVVREVAAMFADRPDLAAGRRTVASARDDVMDARDRLAFADRELIGPLDERARGLVMGSAKRVSVVTAVAPRALIDIAFVILESARLIRGIAELYGIRPGRLGFLRLCRDVLGHLAVTGAIAVGDSIAGEALGHGLASKVSRRFGEGLLNGLMTVRIGISAMDLCRPLPFAEGRRPTVGQFARRLGSPVREPKTAATGD